jgi:hypothetical protein
VAYQPVDDVLGSTKLTREGLGVISKNLGIKPGSKEFHDLKSGNLDGDDLGKGKGKNKTEFS